MLGSTLCILLRLHLQSPEGAGGLVLRQLGSGLDHTHNLGHLVLEHHAAHAGVVGNESLGKSLGRPEIIDQYLSRR